MKKELLDARVKVSSEVPQGTSWGAIGLFVLSTGLFGSAVYFISSGELVGAWAALVGGVFMMISSSTLLYNNSAVSN